VPSEATIGFSGNQFVVVAWQLVASWQSLTTSSAARLQFVPGLFEITKRMMS
jgi:hypothetical protein